MSLEERMAEAWRKHPPYRYGWFPWIAMYEDTCHRCRCHINRGDSVLLCKPEPRGSGPCGIMHEGCWGWQALKLDSAA